MQQIRIDANERLLPHGRNLRPALPIVFPSREIFFRSPDENDLRLRGDDRFTQNHRRRRGQRRENIAPTATADCLIDQTAAADGIERRIPELIKHGNRHCCTAARSCDVFQSRAVMLRGGARRCFVAAENAQRFDVVGDSLRHRRVGHIHGEMQRAKRLSLRDGKIRRRNDQRRFQRDDAFEIQRVGVADDRQRFNGGRRVGIFGHCDQLRPRAGGEHQFSSVRRQRDDALRRRFERDRVAATVGNGQGGMGGDAP